MAYPSADSVEDSAPKIAVRVDQARAATLGVATAEVVATMRVALGGEDVTIVRDGQSEYGVPVALTLPPERQGNLDTLLAMQARSREGTLVALSKVVHPNNTERDRTIYHKDLLPVTYVVGDVAGGPDSPLYGMFAARGALAGVALPQGGRLGEYWVAQPSDSYRAFALKWDGEWQVTYETFRDMGIAYAVGLVLIYLLVVAEFGSYVTPLVIMAPIPLTIIGVMPGHALLGAQFTATSLIGMIALAGIIVRNSILLVDFINLQVARGVPFAEAVVQSAVARAKPIALGRCDARRAFHPRRSDIQRSGGVADLRNPRLDAADSSGDPRALLRFQQDALSGGGTRRGSCGRMTQIEKIGDSQ